VLSGIEPVLETMTRNIKIRAVPAAAGSNLRPGAFVSVSIDATGGRKAILVPANCIVPEARTNKIAVIKGGKVVMQSVEIAYRGKKFLEISSGLNEGDTFAVNGVLYLKPGADVLIRQIINSETEK
jgi:membrane fusion protein (multidrug efflux system)